MSALCQWWTSPAAVRVVSTRAEQPFGIIVDALSAGGSPPAQPLTLNHPASNPGCSGSWGSSF
jgi:hypothetical protein